jgi:predicted phosphodiesterase
MKIQVLSDLHLEHNGYMSLRKTDADVLVLVGDISKGCEGVEWAAEESVKQGFGGEILYIAGNHEFYNDMHGYYPGSYQDKLAEIRKVGAELNVHVLQNNHFIYNGVRFLGTTLWTDFCLFGERRQAEAMDKCSWSVMDYSWIEFAEDGEVRPLEPKDTLALHTQALEWLKGELDKPFNGKTVVLTHQAPSEACQAEYWRQYGNLTSAAFASNLDYLFGKMDLWVHGHGHNTVDFVQDGTRVVSNPCGFYSESNDFDPCFVVDV